MAEYKPADLVVVAVPDDSIGVISEKLAQIHLPKRHGSTVLHTSGALSSAVFADLAAKGWHSGSLHPLISVSDPRVGATAFRKSFWCVEGDTVALRVARQVVRHVGGRSFTVDRKDKPLYHAAAVMSSGNVVALFDVALDMLEKCGLSRRQAQAALLPLLQSTIANLGRLGPEKALTGPFSRGDLATIKLHLSALSRTDLSKALEIYRLLGSHAVNLAKNKLSLEIRNEILDRLR
jgi:predicted short-subunit dehydrogenase-like oxidoreductase (DUF2520 family)